MNVLLCYGGTSREHEVSRKSARYILESLLHANHTVYLSSINSQGLWQLHSICDKSQLSAQSSAHAQAQPHARAQPSAHAQLPARLLENDMLVLADSEAPNVWTVPSLGIWHNLQNPKRLPIDIVFPIIHGDFGEDGKLQGQAEAALVPCVGCDSYTSTICMNKQLTKCRLRDANIPVLPDHCVQSASFRQGSAEFQNNIASTCIQNLGLPLITKPDDGGSSVGAVVARSHEESVQAIAKSSAFGNRVLVEPFLEKKRELEVAVIGNSKHDIQSFPPGEIVIHSGDLYDYNLKYNSKHGEVETPLQADLSQEQQERIQSLAEKSYLTLGCTGFARVDLFLLQDDRMVINEVNTLPGFTDISMFPKLVMNNAEYGPTELMNKLLKLALHHN